MTTKQSEQSRERVFPSMTHQGKLARNCKILPFEFSKIEEVLKGKFYKAYLLVFK